MQKRRSKNQKLKFQNKCFNFRQAKLKMKMRTQITQTALNLNRYHYVLRIFFSVLNANLQLLKCCSNNIFQCSRIISMFFRCCCEVCLQFLPANESMDVCACRVVRSFINVPHNLQVLSNDVTQLQVCMCMSVRLFVKFAVAFQKIFFYFF